MSGTGRLTRAVVVTRERKCTQATSGCGRTVTLGDDEALQKKLQKLQSTRAGRAKLRERAAVEHGLAHLPNRQGPRARYRGVRKNTFDLRPLAALQDLETIARRERASARRAA